MTEAERIWTASVAVGKRLSYEDLKYSDYLYGMESEVDAVWEYVEECNSIGQSAFKEKYKQHKLYI